MTTWQQNGPETDDWLVVNGHETDLVARASQILRAHKDPVFLDVGAHVGLYTVSLAPYCKAVFAIEANRDTVQTLKANLRDNDITNVTPVNVAAWDSQTTLRLFDPNGKVTGASTQTREDGDGQPVLAMPLDTVMKALTPLQPTFVKIDVEGAEAHVLRGMTSILSTARPYLFIEMHDEYLGKPEIRTQVEDLLWDLDYVIDDNLTYGEQYYIRAWPE